jgi:hypothetical protein
MLSCVGGPHSSSPGAIAFDIAVADSAVISVARPARLLAVLAANARDRAFQAAAETGASTPATNAALGQSMNWKPVLLKGQRAMVDHFL